MRNTLARLIICSGLVLSFSVGCGRGFHAPALDETGSESATEIPALAPKMVSFSLSQAMPARYLKLGILESKVELPAGSVISLPADYEVQHLDYRKSDGSIERSSTGFIAPVTLVSVPKAFAPQFPQNKINLLNGVEGGLFLSASIVGSIQGIDGSFAVVTGAAPSADYQKDYETSGKPKFDYTRALTKRFGAQLNKVVSPSSTDRLKWLQIYAELKRAGDRKVATPKALLMVQKSEAQRAGALFEKSGIVPMNGAWTIAVEVTAPKHGFPNVPCAEFQSELLREAYKRAGFDVTEDFNVSRGNRLLWSDSAAVTSFASALAKAGFIPWTTHEFRPLTGAFLMHGTANTPGHTYMSGGDDGRIIVDNGAPQGRDLRKTAKKTIELMFMTGVFFLPPGIVPPRW